MTPDIKRDGDRGTWVVFLDRGGKVEPLVVDPRADDPVTRMILGAREWLEDQRDRLQRPNEFTAHGRFKGERQHNEEIERYFRLLNEFNAKIAVLSGEIGGRLSFVETEKGELVGLRVRGTDVVPGKRSSR